MMRRALLILSLAAALAHGGLDRLYVQPQADCPGGIRGRLTQPAPAIEQVLAIPPDEPGLVYAGTIEGAARTAFTFRGLPMRKYDLLLITADRVYDGLTLHRGADTLTQTDRSGIAETIRRSEPFFPRKVIYRLRGESGRGGAAQALCGYFRDKASNEALFTEQDQFRRTFKLVVLKQVGPGWQIVRARDLYPTYSAPGTADREHVEADVLRGIRVTDTIRDLGDISLGALGRSPARGH
jgi:hypothetical protein